MTTTEELQKAKQCLRIVMFMLDGLDDIDIKPRVWVALVMKRAQCQYFIEKWTERKDEKREAS